MVRAVASRGRRRDKGINQGECEGSGEMTEASQVMTAVVTGICCTGVFGGALKYLFDQLRAVREELRQARDALQARIDNAYDEASGKIDDMDQRKIDADMCQLQHRQILKDLDDGRDKFRDLLTKNTELAADVGRLTIQLALILQRLELSLPKIERAAAAMPGAQFASDGR